VPGVPSRIADARIADAADPDLALAALRPGDLGLIDSWLARPHVARWWTEPPKRGLAEIAGHIASPLVAPFLSCVNGRPVGYLQIYHANPDPFWAKHRLPPETFGLDLFIGEQDAVGRGLGPRFLRLAIRRLFAVPEIVRLQIDPDPANAQSIRAYEKAGFRSAGRIQTPDGAALYMIVERKRAG
jgi:RimJ/RimL family protein N-acetyltransferase